MSNELENIKERLEALQRKKPAVKVEKKEEAKPKAVVETNLPEAPDFSQEEKQRIMDLARSIEEENRMKQSFGNLPIQPVQPMQLIQQQPIPQPEQVEQANIEQTIREINVLFNEAVYRHSQLQILERIAISLEKLTEGEK